MAEMLDAMGDEESVPFATLLDWHDNRPTSSNEAVEAARRIVAEADDQLAGDRVVREAMPGDALTASIALLSIAGDQT